MTKKIIFGIIGIALVVLAAFKLYNNKSEINEAAAFKEERGNIPVETLIVQEEIFEQGYKFTGTFNPDREVNFGAEMQGKIIKTFANEGDYLAVGSPIAKIDDSMLKLQLQNQETQLQVAQVNVETQQTLAAKSKADLERFQNLKKDDAVADITFENQKLNNAQASAAASISKLNVESAKTAIATTKEQLTKTLIKAPISGYLTMKQFEVGSIVAPGAPMGVITNTSNLKLTVMIPENQVIQFRKGQTVSVNADVYPNRQFTGKINQIAAKGDPNHNFKVEVTLTNSNREFPLKAGMYGNLNVSSTQPIKGIFVPNSILQKNENRVQVYVIDNGKAVLRNVNTGITVADKVEITSGLNTGDEIIVTGLNNLTNGITVKTVNQ
ncbi:MAG: efflux RND transporter periplasmic adaptor subunit [Spirosomaceae bacterium]|nr:efflux RND transporter periplasmic adaptor subunit [Spirosomataceae bacterium]